MSLQSLADDLRKDEKSRKVFILMALVLVLAVVIVVLALRRPHATSSPSAILSPDDGKVTGNVYESSYFGFTMNFPKGWSAHGPEHVAAQNPRAHSFWTHRLESPQEQRWRTSRTQSRPTRSPAIRVMA